MLKTLCHADYDWNDTSNKCVLSCRLFSLLWTWNSSTSYHSTDSNIPPAMLNYAGEVGDGNTAAFTAGGGGQDDKSS